jgi:hypothetical protein
MSKKSSTLPDDSPDTPRKTTVTNYTQSDLDGYYESMTNRLTAECEFTTELVGGMAADRAGIEAFCRHHLKLEGDAVEAAVKRIMDEEVGERDVTPEGGEVQEKLTYGLCIIRRDTFGPWLGNWMIKACLKAAASRLKLFVEKKGSKGDVIEMGRVRAAGISLHPQVPQSHAHVHLMNPDGVTGATTYFHDFRGRVSTPAGSMSIISDRECVDSGIRFAFEFRWFAGKINGEDMARIASAMTVIGLGSAKSFERGKFVVRSMEVEA